MAVATTVVNRDNTENVDKMKRAIICTIRFAKLDGEF